MAGLGEMMQYALLQDERKRGLGDAIGDAGAAVGQGIVGMKQIRQKNATAEMDRALKMVEARDKLMEIQDKQRKQEFETNKLKAAGLIPLSPEEQANARNTAFAGIGGVQNAPKDNTQLGRMAEYLNGADEVDFGNGGVTFKIKSAEAKQKEKIRTPGQDDDLQKAIRKMATDMAENDYMAELQKAGTYDPEIHVPGRFNLPEDRVEKYYGAASAFLRDKDPERSKSIRAGIIKGDQPRLDKLQQLKDEEDTIKGDTSFFGKSKRESRREEIKRQREGLLGGGRSDDPFGILRR